MFEDINKNKTMLQGAYRKLKSYYYYNKSFILMRQKIADFENVPQTMEETFNKLSYLLCHPRAKNSQSYINELINNIDFYVVPKKFVSENFTKSSIISNTLPRDKKMKSVNFFINAPIEIHILDALWAVYLAKMDYDNGILSRAAYGNTINKPALFVGDEINYESRILFNRYFIKYSDWRNGAFEALEKQYGNNRDSVLISLDIKSYYYSVSFPFNKLKQYFGDHCILQKIKKLTNIIEKVYSKYYFTVAPYRSDLSKNSKHQYPLPIGLFSSMILANVYLCNFDKQITQHPKVKYYGRYVDDLLIVVDKTVNKNEVTETILDDIFIKSDILKKEANRYLLNTQKNLYVQSDKIKLIYIDHTESKAIIDIYNDTIRVIPSQMDPLPITDMNLSNFDEVAYSVENLTKEKKIRDIGVVGVDSFKVAKYFAILPRQYSQIKIERNSKDIYLAIEHIEKFFAGSQCVEFYSNWLNYMYFLVITERNKSLHSFISSVKKQITELKGEFLDSSLYKRKTSLNKKVKEFMLQYLNTCLHLSLCINSDFARKHFNSNWNEARKYIWANVFDHSFVTFPLSNYLDYNDDISFCKMTLNDIADYPKPIENDFKFKWSPRFIHYDELMLLLFYHYHNQNRFGAQYKYERDSLVNKFAAVNHLKSKPFKIYTPNENLDKEYLVRPIFVPDNGYYIPKKVHVAIGSINITEEQCVAPFNSRWANISFAEKETFFDILRDVFKHFPKERNETKFLVLPELCFPFYWFGDLIRFAKRTQIAIITGLQYLGDDNNRQYNYLATILPFVSGNQKYNNAFVYIREKNDYSPIEFKAFAKMGYECKNREQAEYPIFNWKGIRLAPMICYELTDIVARANLKGKCDFITASVFNPDTTYFSNIIDSTVRDLHAFVIQANTSFYGDSRVTGPYDRDSKDILKVKGGDNDHVVIGTIEFSKYKNYQLNYEKNFEKKLRVIRLQRSKRRSISSDKKRSKPDIKPFSARYRIKI